MIWKVFFILFFLSFHVAHVFSQNQKLPITIFVKPLKCLKQPKIILSEKDMSEIFFQELNDMADFEIKVLSEAETPALSPLSSFLINGDYQAEDDNFTINYQIVSAGNKNRRQNSIVGLGLSAAQKEVKSQISGMFVSVNFHSTPQTATFKIDDFSPGETPQSLPRLLVGKYKVSLEKAGFFGLIQDIDVTRNQTFTFKMKTRSRSLTYQAPQPAGGIDAIIKALKFRKQPPKGQIVVLVEIDKTGKVTGTAVEKSLGQAAADRIVINSIHAVKWKPAKLGKKTAKGSTKIVLNF